MSDRVQQVIRMLGGAADDGDASTPSTQAGIAAVVAVVLAMALAKFLDLGQGFTPRVPTVDALAGLAVGAFMVDRLLTFVPPLFAAGGPEQRTTDLRVLRFGYGALLGMVFVVLTDLRAVHALSPGSDISIDPGLDRAIAVLAIAGGVAGIARLLSTINPQPDTKDPAEDPAAAADDGADKEQKTADGGTAVADVIPPPERWARRVGVVLVLVGAGIALLAIGNKTGIELLGKENASDAAADIVVRFGPMFLAAALVQQLVEFVGRAVNFSRGRVLDAAKKTAADAVQAAKQATEAAAAGATADAVAAAEAADKAAKAAKAAQKAVLDAADKTSKANKPVVLGGLAVALGVVAAWVFHLYLLHNIGFFGVGAGDKLTDKLAHAPKLELWGDVFLTGVAIGAGTKPLHDLSSGLRKAKVKKQAPASPGSA